MAIKIQRNTSENLIALGYNYIATVIIMLLLFAKVVIILTNTEKKSDAIMASLFFSIAMLALT